MTAVDGTRSVGRDVAWCGNLGERIRGKAARPVPAEEDVSEFADAMEMGIVQGIPSCVQPSLGEFEEHRLVVQRSLDQNSFSLLNDAGQTLLMAKASSDGCCFDISLPLTDERKSFLGVGTQPQPAHPSFTLIANNRERKDWALVSLRCEGCRAQGRQRCGHSVMARMFQYIESVGPGQAFCMDMELPPLREDGSRENMCEVCNAHCGNWSMEITSRRPRWNAKHKSLSLDFRGRVSMASAKNFQLESPFTMSQGSSLLLFGKVAEQKFVLDYRAPLGRVQAFAAVLSTTHWQ